MPTPEPEYIQLSSWEELVEWIEKAQREVYGKDWNPKPKRRNKKTPLEGQEGLFSYGEIVSKRPNARTLSH